MSILALVIGGATYMGGNSASPMPTPSYMAPSSTIWGLLQPFNKSLITAPPPMQSTQAHTQTSVGSLRDMSLSMFAPWGISPGSAPIPAPQQPNYFSSSRGQKRKRDCADAPAEKTTLAEPVATPTIDSAPQALLIDAPRGGIIASMMSVVSSPSSNDASYEAPLVSTDGKELGYYTQYHQAMEVALTDSMKVVNELMEYLTPMASSVYSSVSTTSDDLVKAIDELLLAIQTQTTILSSTLASSSPKFAAVVETVKGEASRAKEEVTFRHSRAKENARRIHEKVREAHAQSGKKAAEVIDGFKRSVAESSSFAKKIAEGAQAKWDSTNLKEEVKGMAEGVKEGLKQSMRVKKRSVDTFGSSAGSSGNPNGRDPSQFTREGGWAKRQTDTNPAGFMSRIVGRHGAPLAHGGGNFKKTVRKGSKVKKAAPPLPKGGRAGKRKGSGVPRP